MISIDSCGRVAEHPHFFELGMLEDLHGKAVHYAQKLAAHHSLAQYVRIRVAA